jgi:ribosomal 30S subunit maturation factor RimM
LQFLILSKQTSCPFCGFALTQPGTVLWLRQPANNLRQSETWYTTRVEGGRVTTSKGARDFLVKFEGVHEREEASAMRACELLIDIHDRPPLRQAHGSLHEGERREREQAAGDDKQRQVSVDGVVEDEKVEPLDKESQIEVTDDMLKFEPQRENDLGDEGEEYYVQELVGMRVEHVHTGEKIGEVDDVLSTGGASDLLLVQKSDASESESGVYIPFVRAIVTHVDEEAGTLHVDPPEGLLTLNQGSGRKSQRKAKKNVRFKPRGRSGDFKAGRTRSQ